MIYAEYCHQVQKALAPFGLSETDDELREGYKRYCAIDEAFGAGNVTAERDATGKPQTYVAIKTK